MNSTSVTAATIEKKFRFPWYMPWKVTNIAIAKDAAMPIDVTWDCQDSDFIVIFSASDSPFSGSGEIRSSNRHAKASVDPAKRKNLQARTIRYAIILTDAGKEDVVEGEDSPPTMVIE